MSHPGAQGGPVRPVQTDQRTVGFRSHKQNLQQILLDGQEMCKEKKAIFRPLSPSSVRDYSGLVCLMDIDIGACRNNGEVIE